MNSVIKLQIDVHSRGSAGANGRDDESPSPLMRDSKANLAQIFNEEQREHTEKRLKNLRTK
jgi:hypothetical protein